MHTSSSPALMVNSLVFSAVKLYRALAALLESGEPLLDLHVYKGSKYGYENIHPLYAIAHQFTMKCHKLHA